MVASNNSSAGPTVARVRARQARSRETRARLIAAARAITDEGGLGALRAEAVVARAGVAKGTFFAHFPDKDHLLAELLRERLSYRPGARDREDLLARLHPLLQILASEPEALSVVVRFSGEACAELGLCAAITSVTAQISADIAALQGQGLVRRAAEPAVLGEACMGLLVHAAATALFNSQGMQAPAGRLASGERLLADMLEALLAP